jgi:glucose-6-phosphate-specific signal transduction histidine kinase
MTIGLVSAAAGELASLGIDPVVSLLLAVLIVEMKRLNHRLRKEIKQVRDRTERLEDELLDVNP